MLACAVIAGCSAQADVQRVVITHAGVAVDGIGHGDEKSLTTRVQLPTARDVQLPDGMDATLWFRGMSATAETGVGDLGFVRRVRLTVSVAGDEGEESESRLLIDHRQEPSGSPGETLTVVTTEDVDVLELLAAPDPAYELSLSGRLPENDWSLSVALTFEGHLSMDLADRL